MYIKNIYNIIQLNVDCPDLLKVINQIYYRCDIIREEEIQCLPEDDVYITKKGRLVIMSVLLNIYLLMFVESSTTNSDQQIQSSSAYDRYIRYV